MKTIKSHLEKLSRIKKQLGSLTLLDYWRLYLIEAPFQLRRNVRTQLHKILYWKLDQFNPLDYDLRSFYVIKKGLSDFRKSEESIKNLSDLLYSSTTDEFRCANKDMKAYLYNQLETGLLTIWVGSWLALRCDTPENNLVKYTNSL